jgi:AcrR family transcriptional regulator
MRFKSADVLPSPEQVRQALRDQSPATVPEPPRRSPPKPSRFDIASIRREQIIQAVIAIIDEQGIQNLSLSEIENKTGMRRGQLTYYFRTKESILLAVFDRLLQLMHQRVQTAECSAGCFGEGATSGWERFRQLFTMILLHPPLMPQFHSLQYTFLSQIAHREDFRQALANLYESWRVHMAEDFAPDLARKPGPRAVSPRNFATLVQALLHGLTMQRAADPEAYDRQEMLDLCLDVLGSYLHQTPDGSVKSPASSSEEPTKSANGSTKARRGKPRRPTGPRRGNHVEHE